MLNLHWIYWLRKRMAGVYQFLIIVIFFSYTPAGAYAQMLDSLVKPKASGTMSATTESYTAFGVPNRSLPFSYLLSGTVTFNVQGLDIPISYTYSNQQSQFLQPFNQIGFKPTYKWFKFYVGYSSMEFSSTMLSGKTFLGGGIEMTPTLKNGCQLRIASFYGRFSKAIEYSQETIGTASFERVGYGGQVGISKNGDLVNVSFFKAKDLAKSITVADQTKLAPQDNLVLGLNFNKNFFKKVNVQLDYSHSFYTKNTLSEQAPGPDGLTDMVFKTTSTSSYGNAVRSNLSYQIKNLTVGATYNYTSRDFTSLGTQYQQTDFSDALLNLSYNVFKTGKISTSLGNQFDDLSKSLVSRNTKLIGSVNYTQSIKDWLNLDFTYSNHTSYDRVIKSLVSDSVNLYQVATDIESNIKYNFGKEKNQSLILTTSLQDALQYKQYDLLKNPTRITTITFGHTLSISKWSLSMTTMMTYNQTKDTASNAVNFGPNLTLSVPLFKKKLGISNTTSMLENDLNGVKNSLILTDNIKFSFSVAAKHSLLLTLYLFNTKSYIASPTFHEQKITINYTYTF